MCQSWEVCTAPNTCSCPPGFTGDDCTERKLFLPNKIINWQQSWKKLSFFFVALCDNCDSNHTCIAAHTCVCPTGLTGNDCHIGTYMHAHARHNHFHAFTVNLLPADINECEANVAGCEHSCTNFHRGYIWYSSDCLICAAILHLW